MSGTTKDYLDFTANGETFDLVLTVEGTTGAGQVTAISGTADGSAATLDNSYEGPDNIFSMTYPYVDYNGISFDAGGVAYNLYNLGFPVIIGSNNVLFNTGVENLTFAVCYLRGTQILTPGGERAVEILQPGSEILTHSGQRKRVVWVGTGKILVAPRRRNYTAPVIVRRGALAENVPHRDLHVTAGHSLFIDGILVPVEFLVNHRSIVWDDRGQEIEIFHVELEDHDVLIANGAPAESYRDDGNRWMFRNADASASPDRDAIPPCAPVLTGGPQVDAVWRRLLARSGPRPELPLTDDPDLHLLADGLRLEPKLRPGGGFRFKVLSRPSSLRIVSRSAAPDALGLLRDPRTLGVAVQLVAVFAGTDWRMIEAADDRLSEGFHAFEADSGIRWTNGDAVIPPNLYAGLDGGFEVVLNLGGHTRYLADGLVRSAA